MPKKITAVITALLFTVLLAACNSDGDGSDSSSGVSGSQQSEPDVSDSSSVPESDPETESSALSDYEETGSHTVDLCNGTGQNITGLRIRAGTGESDYWSVEILNGLTFESGSVVALELEREEWGDSDSWQLEATFEDGTVENYAALPLTSAARIELTEGSFNVEESE